MAPSRRHLLRATALAASGPAAGGAVGYRLDRHRISETGDGLEESAALEARLESTFGDRFEGLDPDRLDLLVDVREVGDASVTPETARRIESLFRAHDIHLQWLVHPEPIDRRWFEGSFGYDAGRILWGPGSFYRRIDPWLRRSALQLVVVHGTQGAGDEGVLSSPLAGATGGLFGRSVNGYSLGSRAAVATRRDREEEASLVLHELAHLGLCHATDPANDGVMGSAERVGLTESEWDQLRRRVSNVHETTGLDVMLRPCLWRETLEGLV